MKGVKNSLLYHENIHHAIPHRIIHTITVCCKVKHLPLLPGALLCSSEFRVSVIILF